MSIEHIKIGDVTPWVQYIGDGNRTQFDFLFPIFENEDLDVYLGAASQPEESGYAIAGAGESTGGTVTFDIPPSIGLAVTLQRNVAIRRTTDFSESGDFRASVINTELDRLTAVAQQLSNQIGRAVRLADTDASGAVQLPAAGLRAGKIAAFDSAGNLIAAGLASSELLVSSFMETLLEIGDAAAVRATLEAQERSEALEEIAALTPAEEDLLIRSGGAWGLRGKSDVLGGVSADLRRQALAVAALSGDRANMVDGIADPFTDMTDIDASSSVGQSFNPAGGYFFGALIAGAAADSKTGSNATSLDGVRPWAYSVFTPAGDILVTHVSLDVHSVGTPGNCTFRIRPNDGSGTVLAQTGSVGVSLGLNSYALVAPVTLTSGTAYLLETARDSGAFTLSTVSSPASGTGFSSISSSAQTQVMADGNVDAGEHLRVGVRHPEAFTLVSQSFAADAEPDRALIHVQAAGGPILLNTDLIAGVSRDGGTTWTTGTLVSAGNLADGTGLYEAGAVDLSGQPGGTDMRYRIEIPNARDIRILGALLQWG